jgi:hypothetical protein
MKGVRKMSDKVMEDAQRTLEAARQQVEVEDHGYTLVDTTTGDERRRVGSEWMRA